MLKGPWLDFETRAEEFALYGSYCIEIWSTMDSSSALSSFSFLMRLRKEWRSSLSSSSSPFTSSIFSLVRLRFEDPLTKLAARP